MAASNVLSTLRKPVVQSFDAFHNGTFHKITTPIKTKVFEGVPLKAVVIFTWLGAKERYAHKYVNSWLNRGFHTLHVTTSVMDLLRPRTGAEVTAARTADFLDSKQDLNFIMHGLSVGGFISQRALMWSKKQNLSALDRISHQIYDSFTNYQGITSGVENAVPSYYKRTARIGANMADKVAKFDDTSPLIEAQKKVSPVKTLILPESQAVPHVAIFRYFGEDTYMNMITDFLDDNENGMN